MSISPARAAAFDILLRVERTDAYATELLHSAQFSKLSAKDHGLATEIVMGVLRWRSVLDEQVAQYSSQKLEKLDPEVITALRIGTYQLGYLSRVPQSAAVNESVELVKQARKRSASSLVNAVLRRIAVDKPGEASSAVLRAHPSWLVSKWEGMFGREAAGKICAYDQTVPEVAIRVSGAAAHSELSDAGIKLAPGRILASANRVDAGEITNAAAFKAGRVFIQDEASQLVAMLVGKGKRVLDCCAAPGGKARIMAERNPTASIIALELHEHRARLLRKLVPAANVQVLTADAREFRPEDLFDRVLVDAPCSGTGTLARNPEIKWRLQPEDLSDLHTHQLDILQSAMKLTAPGGRVVYSTCSLEREENSDVVAEALEADRSFHLIESRAALEELAEDGELQWKDLDSLLDGLYLRTIPGVHPCDGFFAAILEKN